MPDRRRFAVVATPLLGLLAAVLAGWSMAAAQEVSGDAGAGPLTLESATVTTITVTWDAVPGATRYDVRWRAPDGIFVPDQATTATRYEITGLSPGSPYVVRVHAIGANGATLKTFRGDFRTTLTAPASLTLTTSTTTSLTVAWTAPAGWTPAGYRLSWRPDGGEPFQGSVQLAAAVRTRTITGLTHGTRYIVRLVALNAAGTESPFTSITAAAREAGPTTARPLTLESAGLTTLTVTWDAVPDAARYDVRWRAPDGVFAPDQAATGTRYEITGLSPGRPYVVRVHPIAAAGATLRQFRGDFRTILTAPATLTVTAASATSLTVNWSAPTGWTPAGYLLSWRPVGPTAWQASAQVAAAVRSHEITGLTDGTKYLIRLTALNPAGTESPPTRVTATAADAAAPLTVTLTSSRDICTANTLTELSWTITGGKAPYRLSIDGEEVDRAAESHRINCGPIPETAAPDPAWEHLVEYRHARAFTATVTDARGVSATGTDLAELLPPLPAPTGLRHTPYPGSVETWWDGVPGVAKLTLEDAEGTPYTIDAYLVRYRAVGAAEWNYAPGNRTLHDVWEVFDTGIREFSVAALRHPLERLTPAALRWSAAHPYAPVVEPQNVVATATHDTVTVQWDKQPHGTDGMVALFADGGVVAKRFPTATSAGRHSITFSDVPPSASYDVLVVYDGAPEMLGTSAWTEVTTLAAPPDYEPPPSGPQNLRATATQNSITVSWDASRPAAPLSYEVQVFHAESGIRVAMRHPPDGVTSVTVIGNYWRIQPDTLYEVVVFEHDIRGASAEISIRTPAIPDQAADPSAGGQGSSPGSTSPGGTSPFRPSWPLRIDEVFTLTDDPFDWRTDRFHAGLDIGAKNLGEALALVGHARGEVRASAPGILRVFNDRLTVSDAEKERGLLPEGNLNVLYCPDDQRPFHQQFHTHNRGWAYWDGSSLSNPVTPSRGDVYCYHLVTVASGRTALIFHRDGYVTKYAHLVKGSIPSELLISDDRDRGLDRDGDGYADPEAAVSVQRHQKIGALGRSGFANPQTPYQEQHTGCAKGQRCEEAFVDPHLHYEIRLFEGKASPTWYLRSRHCGNAGRTAGTYCEWSSLRGLPTVVDAEAVLRPLPASPIPRDPGILNEIQMATVGRRLFEVTGVSAGDQGGIPQMDVDLSIAFWRPAFYSRYTGYKPRENWHGIRGTRPGVSAYYTHTACADPRGRYAPGPTAGDPDRSGELPRQSRTVRLVTGGSSVTCLVLVGTANPSYVSPIFIPPGLTQFPVTHRVSRDDISLADPEATLRFIEELEAGGQEIRKTLAGIDFHFYPFQAVKDLDYEFCVMKDDEGNCKNEAGNAGVVLELWQGSTKIKQSNDSNFSWSATATGTYFLVVRGDYAAGKQVPIAGPYTLHYDLPQDPYAPPEISAFGVDEDRKLAADFTWHGTADHTVQWEMEYIAPIVGYPSIVLELQDGVGDPWDGGPGRRITFKDAEAQAVGWYLLRGKVCEDSAAKDRTCGGWSRWKGRSPLALAEPKNVAATPGTSSADLAWTEAGDPDGHELRVTPPVGEPYTISIASAPSGASDGDSKARTYTVPDLTPGTSYKLELRATDAQATGEYEDLASDWVAVTVTTLFSVTIAGGDSVTEGTAAQFTLTRVGPTTDALDVTVSVDENRNMMSGTKPRTETVRIDAGSETGTLSVGTVNDSTDEQNSTITATITRGDDSPYALGDPSSATVVVRDNDCTLTVTAGTGGTASGGGTSTCGSSRTATATANAGYRFVRWSGASTSTSASVSITLNGNRSVHANFEPDDCTLTVTAGTGGTATGGGTSPCGSSRTATATANAGYRFDRWSGDSTSTSSSVTIRLNGNKSVHANFTCVTPDRTQTVPGPTETRWTEPVNGKTKEERRTSTQAQQRTVTAAPGTCKWNIGTWENVGGPDWSSWGETGVSRDAPAMPDKTQTVPGPTETRWTEPVSGKTKEEQRTSTQAQQRTVTWNKSTCNWDTGKWEDVGKPVWGPWEETGTTQDAPAKPSATRTHETPTSAAPRWTYPSGGKTSQEQQVTRQPQTRTVTWNETDCGWDTSKWVDDGDATTAWESTGVVMDAPDKPPVGTDTVNSSPFTQTRWVTDPDIPFCILWEEQRTRYWTTITPYSWNWNYTGKNWFKVSTTPIFQGFTYTEWTRTGNTRPGCPSRTQEDGVEGEAESVALAAGDYTLPWGLQRISFTVPAGASVELSLRALESGVQAVVLTSAAGAELVLYPGALADGAKPSPSAADTTLSSIAGTLVLTAVERVAPPTAPANETCAVVTAAASGATAVDMGASLCAAVPTGALSVALGGQTLSLTLPTGYDWLLLRVSPDPAVVGIIDMGSGAYLALDAATGAEQSRQVGADVAATIGALFDAIVTSATPPPAESDGS